MDAHPADAVQHRAVGEIHARQISRLKANGDHTKLFDDFGTGTVRPLAWMSQRRLQK